VDELGRVNVVAIDTCGPVIGVALLAGGEVRSRTERVNRGSETRLLPWMEQLLAEAGLGLAQLDGVAATVGPGAFTGLRVGLATATGLSMATGRPFWGTDSLEPRARRVGGRVLAMLDARKARVYASWYAPDRLSGPADVAPEVAIGWVGPGSWTATGEGALVYADQVRAAGGTIAEEADDPAVGVLAALAAEALARGEGIDPVLATPLYLREADAVPPARG
jgi:tRNA threonylcarbamoyladenosine biosynthesis protein TsaB